MKSRKITLINRLLVMLGIGTSSMLFVACYGAAPQGYRVVEGDDSISVMMGDSVAATFDVATNEAEPAQADPAKDTEEEQ